MLITISVPDNTVRLSYAVLAADGNYIEDDRPVTADMLVKIEAE